MGGYLVIFKQDWETVDVNYSVSTEIIRGMLKVVYPDKQLHSISLLAQGCANLNYKVLFSDDSVPYLLRIYLRDKAAALKEQKISELIKKDIPVPQFYEVHDHLGYRFAVMKFMPGITLRDLLLSDKSYDLADIMHSTGLLLGKIAAYTYPGEPSEQLSYVDYAEQCFTTSIVHKELDSKLIERIKRYLSDYAEFFPNDSEQHLVHADFDPANILVGKIDKQWQVTAVLDWEFAFSGSILCDVANMLRYAHQMPETFTQSFIAGIYDSGVILPRDWFMSVYLLNLFSLLDCLQRSDSQNRPKQCADICRLIHYMVEQIDSYKTREL